jgi:hypothetical protein
MAAARPPLESYQKAFTALYFFLGAIMCYSAVSLWRAWKNPNQGSVFFFIVAAFFVLCGVSYARAWRFHKVLISVSGVALTLYALSLVLLGTEDVGGPWVSVPGAILVLAVATWSFVLVASEHR